MPSSHLILCRPLLLLPPIHPSIRVFSNESTLHMRWPKYWSFSFSIIPSKEIPGLIFFRMDWLDLLAVQGTLKSLLQHHSSKASILQRSAFFRVQPSHPYMTTGKTIALTRRTFVGKVMSLLFNMLSRLVITFLSRSKRLLISYRLGATITALFPYMFPFSLRSNSMREIRSFFPSHLVGEKTELHGSTVNFGQFSSVAQLCPTLCDLMDCSIPGLPAHHHSQSLLKPMSIELVMPSNHLILCRLLLLLPSIFPNIRVFSNEPVLHIRWPKYWRFSFSDLACMHALEKEMATHSSILAWRIPGTEEPGGLPSMGSHRVAHD